MNTSVAAPNSSPLEALAGSVGAGKQPAANPGTFLALLLLLFPGKAAPQLAPQGKGGEIAGKAQADPKISTKPDDQDKNAALAASLLAGSLATMIGPAQPPLALGPHSKGDVVGGGEHTPSLANGSSPAVPAEIAATANASAARLAKSIPESLTETIPAEASASTPAKAASPLTPVDSSHSADAALVGAHGPPDMTKMLVPVARDGAALSGAALTGAGEPAPAFPSTLASAVSTSPAANSSRDSRAATAGPVSAQSASSGAIQALATATAGGDLAAPAPPTAPVSVADQIQNQVSAHIDQLRQMGRVEVQLDLHPPELGRVQLHLAMEDGHMNVRMVVQDDAVKRVMDLQVEPLRVRFSEMGVSVGQFDVRRDGGSANQQQQPASEPSAQAIQTDKSGPVRRRKAYGQLVNSTALVDVMA